MQLSIGIVGMWLCSKLRALCGHPGRPCHTSGMQYHILSYTFTTLFCTLLLHLDYTLTTCLPRFFVHFLYTFTTLFTTLSYTFATLLVHFHYTFSYTFPTLSLHFDHMVTTLFCTLFVHFLYTFTTLFTTLYYTFTTLFVHFYYTFYYTFSALSLHFPLHFLTLLLRFLYTFTTLFPTLSLHSHYTLTTWKSVAKGKQTVVSHIVGMWLCSKHRASAGVPDARATLEPCSKIHCPTLLVRFFCRLSLHFDYTFSTL